MAAESRVEAPVGAVERAIQILKLFSDSREAQLGVTEIGRELGLSKAVVHRALALLRQYDFIELDLRNRQYSLGPAALTLGLAYLAHQDLRERARPYLALLCERTGETATLSLRRGDLRVYIDQVTPDREVRMSVAIGESFPLHAGSSSKAFLAFIPVEEREDYLARQQLVALTPETIINLEELRADLDLTRKRGYAKSVGERQPGAASVAAPVFNHSGEVVGVISVCGPSARFHKRLPEAAVELLQQTREISKRLGFG